ncbi:MAG: HK97 gp10 family phage protein [Pseudonocardiales bacterium]
MRYDPSHAGLAKLLTSPEMRRAMFQAAAHGADAARRVAPRRTGRYRRSIRLDGGGIGGRKHDRIEVHIVADVEYAAVLEFGSLDGSVKPHRTLRAAVAAIQGGGR